MNDKIMLFKLRKRIFEEWVNEVRAVGMLYCGR